MSTAQLHSSNLAEGANFNKLAQSIREEFNRRMEGHHRWDSSVLPIGEHELLCYCNDQCDSNLVHVLGKEYAWVCRARAGGRCRKAVHMGKDGHILDSSFSCVTADQLHPPGRPFICAPFNRSGTISQVECCSAYNLAGPITSHWPWHALLLFAVAVVFSGIGLWVGIYCEGPKRYLRRKIETLLARPMRRMVSRRTIDPDSTVPMQQSQLDRLLDNLEMTMSTGSGSGLPLLAQRTIARQITLENCVGRGRFGEVYVGEWRGEKVAVKLFVSRDEASWQRETEVYRTNMLRHTNLLRWIASDNKDTGTATQLWLITEYLPHGSLYDYLGRQQPAEISEALCIQLIRSIVHGLTYLHTEVVGVSNQFSKPGIAHRDIKSKNILVKNDLTCAIADLGLAVRCKNGAIDMPIESARGGTLRYLAPEVLAGTFVGRSFSSYLQVDIYALALVMWEIANAVGEKKEWKTNTQECGVKRQEKATPQQAPTEHAASVSPYELPYNEYVSREPELEDMHKCVVVEQKRPCIPQQWRNSTAMSELARIIEESWATNPNSRLTALNIRYSIDALVRTLGLVIAT